MKQNQPTQNNIQKKIYFSPIVLEIEIFSNLINNFLKIIFYSVSAQFMFNLRFFLMCLMLIKKKYFVENIGSGEGKF